MLSQQRTKAFESLLVFVLILWLVSQRLAYLSGSLLPRCPNERVGTVSFSIDSYYPTPTLLRGLGIIIIIIIIIMRGRTRQK